MERADDRGDDPLANITRGGIAVGFALAVHAAAFAILSFAPQKPLAELKPPISVKLVVTEASLSPELDPAEQVPPDAQTDEPPSEPSKSSPSEPEPLPVPARLPENSEVETTPKSAPMPSTAAPLSILSTQDSQAGEPIPNRWRLPDGASIPLGKTQQAVNPNFEALTKSLNCLGFDVECAEQRKAVFSEDQLTDTDLVWMRSYAHSGLSNSDLYGMSEAQIRERLGIPTAGKNGFMILPGIAIDGPWWDALHGVNKACDYGIGINDLGAKQLMKRCKPLKPSSRDKIGFIPKPLE